MDQSEEITELLKRGAAGDAAAQARLMPLIYDELRIIGRAQRRKGGSETLNTTALVHETYLKLAGGAELDWPDRRCFFSYAAKAMRSILQDQRRARLAAKRGAGAQRTERDPAEALGTPDQALDLVAVEQALTELGEVSPRLAEVVELHVFAGLEFAEIAQCLGVNERTVFRDWRKARALIATSLG